MTPGYFVFYCELKEEIKEETLQKALDRTMEKYPLFRAVLRKGLFWFYLERRDIPAVVKEEAGAPCSGLTFRTKTLLFRVSYYKNRINFEVFHALTDGTGAMHFLMELVKDYLQEHIRRKNSGAFSRRKYHRKRYGRGQFFPVLFLRCAKKERVQEAGFQLKGEKLRQEDMSITEVCIPVKEIHARAKAAGVSITVFLRRLLSGRSMRRCPRIRRKKPIGLNDPGKFKELFSVPVHGEFFGE